MNSRSIVSKETIGLLQEKIGKDFVMVDELMSKYTTVRVGGFADVLIRPQTMQNIKDAIAICKENNIPYTVIGNGSKVLVKDGGIRGIVIKLMNNFSKFSINEETVVAQAGASIPLIAIKCKEAGLSGLEFACGIPASVGGAVYMNAGAYGAEMSSIVKETTYIDMNGNIVTINNEQHDFGYRQSIFKKMKECENKKNIILESVFKLQYGDIKQISETMEKNKSARIEKQPLEYPSAGSTFKRPEGYYVGQLIDECGLKGYKVGNAQVSMKHSGFIVNLGNATASDFLQVIAHIKMVVKQKFNVDLKEEIEIIGEEL